MSNHSGSRMLSEVITMLRREHCFEHLEKEKQQNLIKEILHLAGYKYDCNSGEILEEHAEYFEMCYCCLAKTTALESGLCIECR